MKIKSLLLGSAATLVAATTAQAADAIVVEPEPVDYVRVCDAYGSGYWYIPGTETCIKIGGYVRTTYDHVKRKRKHGHEVYNFDSNSKISADDVENLISTADVNAGAPRPFDYKGDWTHGRRSGLNESQWNYRGRVNIFVKNETEYGTLSSELRIQGSSDNGNNDGDYTGGYRDADYAIDRAIISLAGFRGGYGDTYWTTNSDYGAGNPAIRDGYYGYDQALFADYTYAWEGFAVTGGVQQSLRGTNHVQDSYYGTYDPTTTPVTPGNSDFHGYYEDGNNTLDWYAGVNWKTDWATIAFTALSDNNAIDFRPRGTFANDDVYLRAKKKSDTAYKVSAIVPFGDTSWKVGGWYAWESNGRGRYIGSGNPLAVAAQDKEWGVWLGGNLTDNFDIYGMYTEISGKSGHDDNIIIPYKDAVGDDRRVSGNKFKQWTVGSNWQPVSGLNVQFEYTNEKRKADYGWGAQYDDKADIYSIRVVRSW